MSAPKRTTGECGASVSRARSAGSSAALVSTMVITSSITQSSLKGLWPTELNRPPPLNNVFFALPPCRPYQCGTRRVLPMAKTPRSQTPTLADLRQEIDRIDEAMHRLLMERGEIIDRLIAVKKTQETGSAFRPAREASMMRALVERHRGILPLDTVEGIWRVIISTFTYVQAPYSVHVDVSGGDAAMRDSARFHFGFTTPCVPHFGAGEVIRAVAESVGDLGMFAVDGGPGAGAWWTRLAPPEAPKIIARLPFVER